MKIKVERPQPGQAKITRTRATGNVQIQLETNAAKADALTNALESVGKLGVDIEIPVRGVE